MAKYRVENSDVRYYTDFGIVANPGDVIELADDVDVSKVVGLSLVADKSSKKQSESVSVETPATPVAEEQGA